jgi:mono/diheme cytochrome c family protein
MARSWIIAGVLGAVAGGLMVVVWIAAWFWLGGSAPWAEQLARDRGLAVDATNVPAPPRFDRQRMVVGFRQYAEACARCHSEPGGAREAWADGLDPAPPDLTQPGAGPNVREIFWIVCHGRPMTGMPAWRAHRSDDDLWDLALFVHALPTMTPDAYARLRALYGPAPATLGLTPDATCYDRGKPRIAADGR